MADSLSSRLVVLRMPGAAVDRKSHCVCCMIAKHFSKRVFGLLDVRMSNSASAAGCFVLAYITAPAAHQCAGCFEFLPAHHLSAAVLAVSFQNAELAGAAARPAAAHNFSRYHCHATACSSACHAAVFKLATWRPVYSKASTDDTFHCRQPDAVFIPEPL